MPQNREAGARRHRQSEMLLQLRETITDAQNLDQMFDLMLEITRKEVSADRMTLFLNDEDKEELFSRRTSGQLREEIRVPNTSGIAGSVFTSGEAVIIDDAYDDPRFNRDVDKETGYTTKSLLCAPIRKPDGQVIGVAQALNSTHGAFRESDRRCLENMAERTADLLSQAQYAERVNPPYLKFLAKVEETPDEPEKTDVEPPRPEMPETLTPADISRLMAREPAFQACSGGLLARAMPHVSLRSLAEGETLQTTGDIARSAFLIVNGAFEVGMPDQKDIVIDQGFLGEEAVIALDTYISTARAVRPSAVLAFGPDAISKLKGSQHFQNRVRASFSGRFMENDEDRQEPEWNRLTKVGESPVQVIGWFLALVAPLLIIFGPDMGLWRALDGDLTTLLAILSSTVTMWVFRLLPDFVPALFAVLASILFGLSPPEKALSGFASESFFMAMSILGLSVVISVSGLSYRILLLLLKIGPANKVWYNLSLFISGMALTPVIPTTNGRAAIITPFLVDLLSAMDRKDAAQEAPRLSMNAISSISLLSAVFLSSKSVNFVIFGMLPPQEQFLFQWLNWFFAASVCGGALLFFYAACNWLLFRNASRPKIDKDLVTEQLRILGPMSAAEWAGVLGLGTLLLAFVTASVHRIDIPWVATAILFSLLMFGFLNKADFRQRIDWGFLIFLGALIGQVTVMRDVGMEAWLTETMSWLTEYMAGDFFTFTVMLSLAIFLVRMALPINATVVIFASLLIPTALSVGFNPWLTGFIILLMSEGFVWPYQASYYTQFISLAGPEGRADDHRLAIMNLLLFFFKLAAIFVSIPFWKQLGIL